MFKVLILSFWSSFYWPFFEKVDESKADEGKPDEKEATETVPVVEEKSDESEAPAEAIEPDEEKPKVAEEKAETEPESKPELVESKTQETVEQAEEQPEKTRVCEAEENVENEKLLDERAESVKTPTDEEAAELLSEETEVKEPEDQKEESSEQKAGCSRFYNEFQFRAIINYERSNFSWTFLKEEVEAENETKKVLEEPEKEAEIVEKVAEVAEKETEEETPNEGDIMELGVDDETESLIDDDPIKQSPHLWISNLKVETKAADIKTVVDIEIGNDALKGCKGRMSANLNFFKNPKLPSCFQNKRY